MARPVDRLQGVGHTIVIDPDTLRRDRPGGAEVIKMIIDRALDVIEMEAREKGRVIDWPSLHLTFSQEVDPSSPGQRKPTLRIRLFSKESK